MRVYCDRQSYEYEFDRFVGHDVWVGVGIKHFWDDDDADLHDMRWIRFLRRLNGGYASSPSVYYEVNMISDGDNFAGDFHSWCEFDIKRATSETYIIVADGLVLIKPLMIYTTDELFSDIVEGLD